jgi:hypothetical protein
MIMNFHFNKNTMLYLLPVILTVLVLTSSVNAQKEIDPTRQMDPVKSLLAQSNNDGKAAQGEIDVIDDATNVIVQEFRQNYQQLKDLTQYNDQLEVLIDRQERKMVRIEKDIASISSLTRSVMPLMFKMIDALDNFVELDVPFLINERRQRIAGLRNLMNNPDASPAEKYRKISEAYEIENEYGRTIEAYSGSIDVDGINLAAQFFRLGRLNLYYMTPDGGETGYWDKNKKTWVHLGGKYSDEIDSALKIAYKQAPPDFINLPVQGVEK